MAFSKKTWKDRQVEHPGRRRLSNTGTTDVYDVTREEGLVIEEGDALNAANFNDLENRVSSAFSESALKEIFTLTHSKSGTTHALTGLSGVSGTVSAVFTATAAYTAGDTFTVDGTAYTVQLSNGETAEDNLFVTGAAVPIVLDTAGKKVNFKAGGGKKKLVTEIILASQEWIVPDGVTSVNVRIFGGGGSGELRSGNYASGGGGGGHMAYDTISVTPGSSVPITIGLGGEAPRTETKGTNGGASSFGTYLTANGGSGGANGNGGDGGTGGGGGRSSGNGGKGSYGGGGGGGLNANGGNGGTYGGGGGACKGAYGSGGTYGGHGGNENTSAENGTNTNGMEGIDFPGQGLAGAASSNAGGGGGGYGGNGGNGGGSSAAGGGGGGYGGNGGNGTECGGGGGGYGGNGGNGRAGYSSYGGAGGGGYGKAGNGGTGGVINSTPAGNGGIAAGGGGNNVSSGNITRAGNGGNGVCIITYLL